MLDQKVDIRHRVSGQNVLMAALQIEDDEKRSKIFQFLIRRGASCLVTDKTTGRNVLMYGCHLGRSDEVRTILQETNGELDLLAKDHESFTALHHCAINGHDVCVRLVVHSMKKYGLTLDVGDAHNITPYMYSKRLGHHVISDFLHRSGASQTRFDTVLFKNADQWAEFGAIERKQLEKCERKQEEDWIRIQGQLPYLLRKRQQHQIKLPHLPQVVVTSIDDGVKEINLDERNCLSALGTKHSESPSDLSLTRRSLPNSFRLCSSPENQTKSSDTMVSMAMSTSNFITSRTDELSSKSDVASHSSSYSNFEITKSFCQTSSQCSYEIIKRSYPGRVHFQETAPQTSRTLRVPTAFQHKGVLGDVTKFLTTLSDQKSESFRRAAKPSKTGSRKKLNAAKQLGRKTRKVFSVKPMSGKYRRLPQLSSKPNHDRRLSSKDSLSADDFQNTESVPVFEDQGQKTKLKNVGNTVNTSFTLLPPIAVNQ